MIGGEDIVFNTAMPAGMVLRACLQVIAEFWPDAVLAKTGGGPVTAVKDFTVDANKARVDMLVYRNAAAQAAWARHGSAPAHMHDMIYILAGTTNHGVHRTATLVVGDSSHPETRKMLHKISPLIGVRMRVSRNA